MQSSGLFPSVDTYQYLVNEVRDYAILILDVNGYIQTWNEGAKLIMGYEADEVIGTHYSVLHVESDQKSGKSIRELEEARACGRVEDNFWRVKKGGERFWANIIVTTIKDSAGSVLGFGKIIRDFTSRRKEEEIASTLKLLVDNVQEYAIFLLDVHGNVKTWNEGARRIKQYEAHEIIGQHFSIFFTKEDQMQCKPDIELENAKCTGRAQEEYWRVRKDGTQFWASIVITALYDEKGELIGFGKVTRDMTEILSSRINAESAQLRSQFLANMSHEIRTPMNGVTTAVNLILQEQLSAEQRDLAEIIQTSGLALTRVVNDILEFSKLEKDEIRFYEEKFSIQNEVESIVKRYATMKKTVNVSCSFAHLVPDCVSGEPLRLSQLITNLVDNALKFTLHGSVTVRVTSRDYPNDKIGIFVTVADTGVGMANDDMAKLFNPFTQLDATSKRRFKGTGLGLSICKKLVEKMGGQISLNSRLGKGTTFFFNVYFTKCVGIYDHILLNDQLDPPRNRDIRILLAEDNLVNRKVACKVLKSLGYDNVDTAVNGYDAVEKFKLGKYSIILMDVRMPEMDGYEATAEIRKLDSNIPIIAMTANAMHEDREMSFQKGMTDYVSKPIDVPDLSRVLNRYT